MELRKDYLLDRYVIISESRNKRPNDFATRFQPTPLDTMCFFCPGHEDMTTAEKGRVGEPWRIRWFNNKYAFLSPEGKPEISTDNNFFTYSDAFGYHEVIVETNDHNKQLPDLTDFDLKELLKVYKSRIEELSKMPHIKYVFIFKNSGLDAGTSVKHSHTQVTALNNIPRQVQEKLDALAKFNRCPYCDIINIEKISFRKCYENNNFVAFTPYASRFNYEIWIFPKKHYLSVTQLDDWELLELAQIMKKILMKLKEMNVSYNIYYHNSPQNYINNSQVKGMHFHVEICPRMSLLGGFELGTDIIVNSVSPETAARFYRGEQ
jgi:UDPglucose--hexose-1-phosphate uridylyltransferase